MMPDITRTNASDERYMKNNEVKLSFREDVHYKGSVSHGLITYTFVTNDDMPRCGTSLSYSSNMGKYQSVVYNIQKKIPKFLICQSRDTFEYIDFLRGTWKDMDMLKLYFSLFSAEERNRIMKYNFDNLWDDVWVHHDFRLYKDGYIKAKKKYMTIRHLIPDLLKSTTTKTLSPGWGFPKGKRNSFENSRDCAIREFFEETRIPEGSLVEKESLTPLKYIEEFKGTNDKYYKTYYNVAEIDKIHYPTRILTPQCIRETSISEEINDIKWVTIDEAKNYLNARRYNILLKVYNDI